MQIIQEAFQQNPGKSAHYDNRVLTITYRTVWHVLRQCLVYKLYQSQALLLVIKEDMSSLQWSLNRHRRWQIFTIDLWQIYHGWFLMMNWCFMLAVKLVVIMFTMEIPEFLSNWRAWWVKFTKCECFCTIYLIFMSHP